MLKFISRVLFLGLGGISLASCVLIPEPYEIPWVDRINLHADPRPGDFAMLAHQDNLYDNTWRVEKVDGDKIEVSLRTEVHAMTVNLGYQNHFLVDRDGRVLDAWIRYDNGDIKSRPVADRGQPGGYQNFDSLAVSPGYRITTAAGDFAIDAGRSFSIVTDLGLGTNKGQRVEYLSSEVPFRTVKIFNRGSFESGAMLSLLETVTLAGSATLNSTATRVFEQTLEKNSDGFEKIELESYGFGKP